MGAKRARVVSRLRRVSLGGIARATALAALALGTLVAVSQQSAAAPFSLGEWCAGYLAYIGVPARGPSDAHVLFLEKWATVEGTFYLGNTFNPLDTELPEPGNGLWNAAGVRTYPTLNEGYLATLATMQQSYDAPILAGLRDPRSTLTSLTRALADSNWTGYGPYSADETGYAGSVGGVPVANAGNDGPNVLRELPAALLSTVTVRGVIVNPAGKRLEGICVSAVPKDGLAINAVTQSNGVFRFDALPSRDYRLRITDCHFVEGGVKPTYYDVASKRHDSPTRATVLALACANDCRHRNVRLSNSIVYGSVDPTITWPSPAPITYGTSLTSAELDAASSTPGRFVYSPALATTLSAGEHDLDVTFVPNDTTDYRSEKASVPITVDQASPQVTWPSPAPITYGTELSSTQLDATSSVPGSFHYQWPAHPGEVLAAGTDTLAAWFTPNDTRDYSSTKASVPISVAPATPTLTLTPASVIVAGSLLSDYKVDADASTWGTFSWSPPLGTPIAPGPQTVTVTFTPSNTTDYVSTTESVIVTGTQITPPISWSTPRPVAAGKALTSWQLDARTWVSGSFSYSPPLGTILPTGTDTLATTFTPTNTVEYTTATATTTIVVKPPITPTITWATPDAITQGTALSSTELDARASVPGTFTYSPPAGTFLPAGNQTLTASFTPTNDVAYATTTASVVIEVNESPATTIPATTTTTTPG